MKRTTLTAYFISIVFCAAAAALAPDGRTDYDMSWHTIDGGGGLMTGGDFVLSGTIGQPDAGVVLTGGSFSLTGGFWHGGDPPETRCPEDLVDPPGVEQQDLNAVLNRWGDPACELGGTAYPCPEDLASPDGVEQQDLNAVLNRWGDPACEPVGYKEEVT